jgi:membrane-associated phospholipid phosphatase
MAARQRIRTAWPAPIVAPPLLAALLAGAGVLEAQTVPSQATSPTAASRWAPPARAVPAPALRATSAFPAHSLSTSASSHPTHSLSTSTPSHPTLLAVTRDTAAAPFFTARDAWLALGFAAGTVAMAPLDRALADALQDSTLQVHRTLRHTAAALRFLGFPGTAILGTSLYAVGRVGGLPRMAEVGLHGAEAVALSYVFVWTGKNVLGRARPAHSPDDPFDFEFGRGFSGGSEYLSFPSGHTAAAFAFSAALAEETRHHWPEAYAFAAGTLYAAALLVGVSRMYHNRHWASDVVIGAGIGSFSGLKVVHYHHRHPDNAVDRLLLPRAVVPTDSGLLLVWTVPSR